MLANIFRKTTLPAFFAGLILVFLSVYFFHSGHYFNVLSKPNSWWETLSLAAGFASFIGMMQLLEVNVYNNRFTFFQWLSFPVVLTLMPSQAFSYLYFIQALLLYMGFRACRALDPGKSEARHLFHVALCIGFLMLFDLYFTLLAIIPISFLFRTSYRNLKSIWAFLLPLLLLPFTYAICLYLFFGRNRFLPPGHHTGFTLDLTAIGQEHIWIVLLFIFIITLFLSKTKNLIRALGIGNYYMLIWLLLSFVFGLLGWTKMGASWWLSFFPAAYFLGLLLKYNKSKYKMDVSILLLLTAAVLFRIFF